MQLLFDILYAAHAKGTHHKLALDALNYLRCDNAQDWRDMLLKYHEPYLRGSKAPDKEFKDFRNHVLHVSQNYWGGAPKKARQWYEQLVQSMRCQKWREVAYNAGVLSHYYTDPIQPFHTAQSEAENNIHRAAEWSISKSYNRLRDSVELIGMPNVPIRSGDDWLEQMVRDGAKNSHKHYQTLIDHYNFRLGRKDPPRGLDRTSREILARLIGYAIVGFARILDRAIEEASVDAPQDRLMVETFFATLEIPIHWVTKRIEDKKEAELVKRMYREFQQKGKVEVYLTEDVRTVRDELHASLNESKQDDDRPKLKYDSVSIRKSATPSLSSSTPESKPKPKTTAKPDPVFDVPDSPTTRQTAREFPVPQPKLSDPRPTRPAEKSLPSRPTEFAEESPRRFERKDESPVVHRPNKGVTIRPKNPNSRNSSIERHVPRVPEVQEDRQVVKFEDASKPEPATRDLKFYLEWTDPVDAAPSIGSKTSRRLGAIGIRTVAQLISASPEQVAERVKARHITQEVVEDWQAQAVLAYRIPMLRGHDAQFLVACGYRTPEQVAQLDANRLLEDVLEFVETSEGQRILRGGKEPDLAEVCDWIAWSNQARRASAA